MTCVRPGYASRSLRDAIAVEAVNAVCHWHDGYLFANAVYGASRRAHDNLPASDKFCMQEEIAAEVLDRRDLRGPAPVTLIYDQVLRADADRCCSLLLRNSPADEVHLGSR